MTRLLDRPAVPSLVAEATRASAQPRSLSREALQQVLLARCGAEWFAIPAAEVVRVSPVPRVHPLPHRRTESFRGVAALAGAIVPVIDLSALLGCARVPEGTVRRARMVQVGRADRSIAFEADEVPGVHSILSSSVRDLPVTVTVSTRRIGCGLVPTTHGIATLVDPARMHAEFDRAVGT